MTEALRLEGLPRARVERVSEALFAAGAMGLQEEWLPGQAPEPAQPWDDGPRPPEPDHVVLVAWFEDADHAEVEQRIRSLVSPIRPAWSPAPEEDWEARWREGFAPIVISDRLVIAPPWDAPEGALVIEPGQGFGTGQHPTTVQALQALDRLATDPALSTALDVGCGSGILALAAARLGLSVTGIDVEEAAVREAGVNALRNGLSATFSATPISALVTPVDLVLANLHAELVEALAADLVRLTGTWLVVAGILEAREARVTAALDPHLQLHSRAEHEGWVCRVYRRATATGPTR